MNKKKLLFIVNVDWFFVSHRLPIAIKAVDEGYDVHLLCAITNKYQEIESHGITIHPFSLSRSGTNVIKEIYCTVELYKKIKSIKPDLVHLVTIKPVLYGGIAARLAKVPAVVSAISGLGLLFVKKVGLQAIFMRTIAIFLYRVAMEHPNQRVIFQNPSDKHALEVSCGMKSDKTRMVRGSGVNLKDYPMQGEPDGILVIVMVARLLRYKGVNEFVDAAKIIKSKKIASRFLLVGEPDVGNPESISNGLFQQWKDEGIVQCLGYRSDIAELFSMAHIVVLPSYYGEGLPKVLVEAAACGRAVITTDMPGCRDAIEANVTGLLVPARNTEALVQAIEYMINNSTLRKRMGRSGRELAEREFSIEKVVRTHLEIYDELIKKSDV